MPETTAAASIRVSTGITGQCVSAMRDTSWNTTESHVEVD